MFQSNLASISDKKLRELLQQSSSSNTGLYEVFQSRTGDWSLKWGNVHFYSKYNPLREVEQFIRANIDPSAEQYVLFGFGLGYHVEQLMEAEPEKKIAVADITAAPLSMAMHHRDLTHIFANQNITINLFHDLTELQNLLVKYRFAERNTKIIIPKPWIHTIDDTRLKNFFEDIKIHDMSYQRFGTEMEVNFYQNIKQDYCHVTPLLGKFKKYKAALISAGPSLDDCTNTILSLKNKYFLLCVGSAYRTLYQKNIKPDAVIVTDSQKIVLEQFRNLPCDVPMFFLSTASKETVAYYSGKKIILLQRGYDQSESLANSQHLPLFDTGGSVATTGLELLIQMGFQEIVFFGQDLAYRGHQSHSLYSSSNKQLLPHSQHTVRANNGKMVHTSRSWNAFRNWIEKKIAEHPEMMFFNTSFTGAEIKGAPYTNALTIENEAQKMTDTNFAKKVMDVIETKI